MDVENSSLATQLESQILIVDDQKFNVDALKILIGMSSSKITPNMISEAFDGQEAINEVHKRLKGNDS